MTDTLTTTAPFRMPAKSISWRWNAATEAESTEAKILYNGTPRGRITKSVATGEWNGFMSWAGQRADGTRIVVEIETLDGYTSIREVGNQLYRKFRRATEAAGCVWPY